MHADHTPTVVPPAWPTEAELCPPGQAAYPACPNTDDRPTWVPEGGDDR